MLSLYTRYLEAVREANRQEPSEWTFKSDPRYQEVLEHTPARFAELMLDWSLKALPDLDLGLVWSLCDLNDSVGKPMQEWIAPIGKCAPSNMRYLCHAIKLWQYIDSLGQEAVDIVEIGGGYGGLALWVEGLQSWFATDLLMYTVLDLSDVAVLTEKAMRVWKLPWSFRAFDLRVSGATLTTDPEQFCFSAYAFSEFDQATRDWYAERVVKQCRHGMMIWNFPDQLEDDNGVKFGGPPYPFVKWPMMVVPDEPRLYEGHLMVTW